MEANNMKAMREACQKMLDLLMLRGDGKARCVLTWDEFNESQLMLRAALSAPPRQCDIGTADEQSECFENFCLKHIGCAEETGGRHCIGCPLEKASRNTTQKCELYWAQMPHEAKDGGAE